MTLLKGYRYSPANALSMYSAVLRGYFSAVRVGGIRVGGKMYGMTLYENVLTQLLLIE